MRLSIAAPGRVSSTAVGRPSTPSSGRQNASIRASSRSRSISALLTCAYASTSLHRSRIGTWMRITPPLGSRRSWSYDPGAGVISPAGRSQLQLCHGSSVASELAVDGAVGLGRVGAQALDLVLLVGVEVALEPVPVGGVLLGALVGEDVRRDAVEEPPVVGDDDGAAGELEQRVLERLQGLDVEVVGGLVEEQQVAALLEREREVETVALTAREHAGLLLLVGPLEAELRHVGAARDLGLADRDDVEPVGDALPQRLVGVDVGARLVDVADLDRLADLQLAAVERLEAHDRLEERGLSHTVRADDADDAVRRERERQAVDEHAVAERLLQVLRLDHDRAQARPRRDLDLLEVELARALGFGGHLLVAGQTRLRLGLSALGVRPHPLELLGEALGELGVLLALHLQAL